jgi:2-ketoarginine methyltransferase
VRLMKEIFTCHPDSHWVVIEVDNRISDRGAMAHELARAYYNPYFLIHYLTEQRLETTGFWNDLFAEAGAEIVNRLTTEPRVDSTGFELGYLLRAARSGSDR